MAAAFACAVVDDFTRESLALIADTSLPSLRVGRELDAIVAIRATLKIGLANLAYNMKRFIWLERTAPATLSGKAGERPRDRASSIKRLQANVPQELQYP
jgi:hypothetical protein